MDQLQYLLNQPQFQGAGLLGFGPLELIVEILAGSMLAGWLLTFGVRSLARSRGVIARRDARRRHERDTPLLGGTAIFVVIAAVNVLLLFGAGPGGEPWVSHRFVACFLAALTLIFGVGVWDDCSELKAAPKFLIEFLAAGILMYGEPHVPVLFSNSALPAVVAVPILVLWIVGLTNAMNMIDGLDGLCSGVAAISAVSLTAIWLSGGNGLGWSSLTMIALAGACAGFLLHNFNPARIFLGDSGSLVLGFTLAVASMQVPVKRSLLISISVPFLLLGLPLIDVVLAVIRRQRADRPIFRGDRSHIHHRLQRIGLSHRRAVLFLWTITAYLNATAYFLSRIPPTESFVIYSSVLVTVGFWLMTLFFLEKRLAYQTARYGHLFLKHQVAAFADRNQLIAYVGDQVARTRASHRPFTVVVIDCEDFLREMIHERPNRIVAFYMDLYSALTSRLRLSDLVARISDYRVVVVLPECDAQGGERIGVLNYISNELRLLQGAYNVFQGDSRKPEGYAVHVYPGDATKIWKALRIEPSEIELLVASTAAEAA